MGAPDILPRVYPGVNKIATPLNVKSFSDLNIYFDFGDVVTLKDGTVTNPLKHIWLSPGGVKYKCAHGTQWTQEYLLANYSSHKNAG